jgi:type IV pilus assembly protein PilM
MAVDIGATGIKLAEFASHASGQIELVDFCVSEFEEAGSSEMAQEALVATALKRLLDENKYSARTAVIAFEGQSVFSRRVKLPPVSKDRQEQTIRHEAVQNIPFPIDEVVWDYQIIDPDNDEPEVLLVAVKGDLASGMTHAVEATGLSPEIIDIAPAALSNTVRYTYPDLDCSALVVDVGAQSVNLVFIDGAHTFFRTLSVAGNQAEHMIPEVGRSIAYYCNQQQGRAPKRIFLSGRLDGLDAPELTFSERLNLPVEILNPLIKIKVSPGLNRHAACGLGVLVGLAIHNVGSCVLKINLVPESLRRERSFRKRQPLMVACVAAAVLLAGMWSVGLSTLIELAKEESSSVAARISELEIIEAQLVPIEQEIKALDYRYDVYRSAIARKAVWAESLMTLHGRLLDGMFLSATEPIRDAQGLVGIRMTVISYLDKEPVGQDPVILLRDQLRKSERFTTKSEVVTRPTKKLFARSFVIDAFFEEPASR